MKTILFPTDFSNNADHALNYAIKLCHFLEAELVILHSCRMNSFTYQLLNDEQNDLTIVDQATKDLQAYCKKHSKEISSLKVTEVVEYGLAADVIINYAKNNNVFLIVMGTKGARGIEEILIGSNTSAVIQKATRPILAIPVETKIKDIEKIAFATDFRENDIDAIQTLSGIASLFNAEIIMTHITDFLVPINYEKALMDVFEDDIRSKVSYKNISFRVIKGNDQVKALNHFIEENNIDLIAVSTRKKNIITRLFDKSFTKKIAAHTTIPLLAFHDGK